MLGLFAIRLVVLSGILTISLSDNACDQEFRKRHYIPDYADGIKSTDLKVIFDNQKIKCGDNVSLQKSINAPTLKYDVTGRCKYVTVIQISPSGLLGGPYLGWLVHNIDPEDFKAGFNNGGGVLDLVEGHHKGDVRAPYAFKKAVTGGVARDSFKVYFIYCQCSYISKTTLIPKSKRKNFNVKKYAKKQGLMCPVAGFFHLVSATGMTLPGPNPAVPVPEVPLPNTPNLPWQNKSPFKEVVGTV